MPKTETMHDAFIDELRDMYDAEKQLTSTDEIGEGLLEPEAAADV